MAHNQAWSTTLAVNADLRPAADDIYRAVFPGCLVSREVPLVLDQAFAIDAVLTLGSGSILTVQEKFRSNKWLASNDFTQEYKNADGTQFEAPGEWFKIVANLYFYGWGTLSGDSFQKWAILDVFKYKLYVELSGGLQNIGKLHRNNAFGRASFYSIPMSNLEPVFFTDWRKFRRQA